MLECVKTRSIIIVLLQLSTGDLVVNTGRSHDYLDLRCGSVNLESAADLGVDIWQRAQKVYTDIHLRSQEQLALTHYYRVIDPE